MKTEAPPDVVFNPLHKAKYGNHLCLCGGEKKLKHCHGKATHIPRELWHIARTYERYIIGEITLENYNSLIKLDNHNRVVEAKDWRVIKVACGIAALIIFIGIYLWLN